MTALDLVETRYRTASWPIGHVSAEDAATALVEHACCGDCYIDNVECIMPVLQLVLHGLAQTPCEHAAHRILCGQCAIEVAVAAERCRNSGWWISLDEESTAHHTFQLQMKFNLVEPAVMEAVRETFDFEEDWLTHIPFDFLRKRFLDHLRPMTVQDAHQIIDDLQEDGLPEVEWPRLLPRKGDSNVPPRASFHRAELEIAKRYGLAEPARYMIERQVRAAAADAWSEADFVRIATQNGVRLTPFVDPSNAGVIAYSATLANLPADIRRDYGGKSLARDLTLHALRELWGPKMREPATQSWAAWEFYTGATPTELPVARTDHKWRWVHPDAPDKDAVPVPDSVPNTANSRRQIARAILDAGQGGWCAMCAIRRRNWRSVRRGLSSEEVNLVAPGDELDHDHRTGSIRGLLCRRCNNFAEPTGSKCDEVIWLAYTANPPANDLGCSWPYEAT